MLAQAFNLQNYFINWRQLYQNHRVPLSVWNLRVASTRATTGTWFSKRFARWVQGRGVAGQYWMVGKSAHIKDMLTFSWDTIKENYENMHIRFATNAACIPLNVTFIYFINL